jgi:excisionase family DNA binding protein
MTNFLTVRQTADLLNMHFMSVYKMVQNGTLPALKIGNRWKIREDLLQDWIEEQGASASRQVLVIDEDPTLGERLRQTWGNGTKVVSTTQPEEALAQIERTSFDLILLDLDLERTRGVPTYRRLRERINGHTRIVLTTSDATRAPVAEALQYGPIALLQKPFSAGMVRELVNKG